MNKRFTYQFVLMSFLLLIAMSGFSININVGGAITSNTTWNADTVKVDSNVTINDGYTLTITAGTYVQFQGHYGIYVQGRLLSQGTKTSPIEYAPVDNNIGWAGIRFHYTPTTNDTSKIEYCRLSHGKANAGGYFDKIGGAIYINGVSKLLVINNYISNNYASYFGGGIGVRFASPTIVGNVIVNNTAPSLGGGLYIYSAPSQMILMNNTVANNYAYNGGGVYVSGSNVYFYNGIIWGNSGTTSKQITAGPDVGFSAVQGGYSGGYLVTDKDPKFASPTTGVGVGYDGMAADYGLQASSPVIDAGYQNAQSFGVKDFDAIGNFRFDNEKIDMGALEYISATEVCGSITSNTTWSGNILVNCNVYVNSGKTLTIMPGTKIIFTGNYYLRNYGRILAQGTSDNKIIFTAWNKSNGWGGIYSSSISTSNDTSKYEYCDISYGKRSYGAGFYISNSSKILIRNCIIRNNKASYYGGAIYLSNSSPRIIGNLFINNEAGYSRGGAFYITGSSSSPLIYNNTIARNKSASYGAGVYVTGATPVIKNNIIWGNEDASGNHSASDNIYPTTGINITYSDIEGGYSGTGNKNLDPKFKYASYSAGATASTKYVNFTVESTSPCIDAGTPATSGMSLPTLDINGKQRVYNSHVDMGSYEDKSYLNVCGTISSDQVWDANIININCNVTISNGATVTIIPGTEVRFSGHYSISVKGALQALGAKNDTIVFTSTNTSTGWDGVQIDDPYDSNDSSIFDYCKFEYANRTPSDYRLGGGALTIRSFNKVRVTNSNFSNNTTSGSNARAAAVFLIYVQSNEPEILISNNKFTYNSGSYGIVSMMYGQIILRDNEFYSNTTSSGATIKLYQSGADVENNMIANNIGNNGGGISLTATYLGYKIRLVNNIIANNKSYAGAGINIYDVQPELYNNTIVNNECTGTLLGGGIYFYSNADAIMRSNIIYGNKASGSVANQLCINDLAADPKIYNCDIEGDVVAFSGVGAGVNYTGVYSENFDANPLFVSPSSGVGNTYNGHTADWSIAQGSPLINAGYSNSGSIDLPNTDYAGEDRIFNGRIDIGAFENQDPIVAPCTISTNTIWEADTINVNCDVVVNTGKTLTINPGTKILFSGYYSITVNGAIVAKGMPDDRIKFMINDTTGFYDPTVSNGSWHGIKFNSVALINDSSIFSYCVFTHAKATGSSYSDKSGGAMNIYNSSKILIENCLFSNNSADYQGGGLYLESSNISFRNNVVVNNYATSYGAGIYVDDVTSDFTNLTVAYNKTNPLSFSSGGGMYISGSVLALKNCIFWGNTDYYSNGQFSQLIYSNSSSSEIYNCDIQFGKNYVGNGGFLATYQDNYSDDPLFSNPTAGSGTKYDGASANWSLKSNTNLINKGLQTVSYTGLDFMGNMRLVSDTIDIGASEVQLSRKFISYNPASRSVCENTSTTFTVGITIPTNYQWMHNGNVINGANSSSYTVSNTLAADTGLYYCIMSTSNGSVNSDTAELGIQIAPAITSSPTSTAACVGDTASFSVGATGTAPLVYTWQNSLGQLQSTSPVGVVSVGVQTSTNSSNGYPSTFANYYWGNKYEFIILASELTAAGLSPGDITALAINVINVNSCPALSNYTVQLGSTSSSTVSSNFNTGLTTVFSTPSYQPVSGWNTVNFQTPYNWNGTSNLVVQICSNNSSWVNGGNASIALATTSFNSALYYKADNSSVCSYSTGSITTKRPVVRIKSGTNNLVYYSIDSVLPSDASVYKCNVSNMCGSALSTGAQLTVNTAPVVVPIIGSASVCENQSYTYTTSATGTAPITYQWIKDGSSVVSTSVSHSISSVSPSDDGIYYCKATNACGDDSTNQSVLTVSLVPTITAQASSLIKCEGQSAMFTVQASGSPTLSYQWYKGGSAVTGGNSSSLLISPVSSSDAGSYYCVVTNSCGSATSTMATLTVNSNVAITAQSSSQTLCEGSSPTLSVTANGTAPITYQWYDDNGLISGATNNTYSINTIDTSDAGNYYCIATNTCTSTSSNSITINVNEAPNIDNNPVSAIVCENYSTVFSVSISGTNPMTYQWYNSSGAITGATGSSYIIPQVASSDAGSYYVKATNACGTATSQNAILTVNTPVSITAQSTSTSVCSGVSPSLSITAAGTAPISYQWYKDGSAISSATNNSLILTSATSSDAANYYVVATNSCNSVQSNTMNLTVNEGPSIVNQPTAQTVCEGTSTQLNVSASGTAPMTYQWYKAGSLISGATNNNYIISSASSTDAATYYVKVTNSCGNVNSQNASITVKSPASITAQSTSTLVCAGASPSLSVTAIGTAPLTYQWYKDGSAISSATNNTYNLTSVDTSDDATYYAIVTNSCNSDQSNPIILTVNESPSIITQPVSSIACSGSSAMLSVSASGTAPLSYQWYKGGSPITGAISNTYLIGSVASTDGGSYYCKITNTCATVTSNNASLVVNNPALITSQSGDSTKCVGDAMMFSVSSIGTAPISYQWYHNGNALTGGTSSAYSINAVALANAGDYYCIVSNACNSTQSNVKNLVVNTAPAITQQSSDTSVCSGNNLTLNVTTSGSSPMSYQWFKSSTAMGGAINNVYPMYQISTSDAATYYCVATNSCGTAQSNNMVITVNSPPSITYQSADSTRCEGESMTFKVTATGTAPLSYQWYNGQSAINGGDTSIYNIASVVPADNGNYHAVITNACASVSSAYKYLTVHATPQVNLGNDTTFCDGGSVIIGPGYGYYAVWNTGQIASQLNITTSGTYSASVVDQYGCNGYTDTINVNVVLPYANQEICLVTVDSATGKNVIVWEKTPNMGISSFNVYKESNISGVYSLLANRPYDSLSVVLDLASNPTVSAERYAITVVDSCGNESPFSPAHRTMHMTVNKGQNNDWNLIWNAYEGFTPSSYKIYRADTSLNFVNIATVSGSSSYTYLYTDQSAPANVTLYYYVEVVHPNGGCSATKGTTNYNSSRSNRANSGNVNASSLLPAFFGTPTSGVFPLEVHFFDQSQGNPIEWEWDFGDGSVDSVQNPVHSYTQIGVYSVSLIVKDAGSMNSVAFQNYITVLTTGIAEVDDEFVVKVFPNPYSDKTSIAYALTNQTKVVMEVYTSQGQKVAELINAEQSAGSYKVQFRAADYGFASGVYILRMHVGDQLITKKLIEVK